MHGEKVKLNDITLEKCPHLSCLHLKMAVWGGRIHINKNRHALHHIHTLTKIHIPAHTLGVNVKASTLQGHREPQIHLCPDSSPPLAIHTKNVDAECTHIVLWQEHTHDSNT